MSRPRAPRRTGSPTPITQTWSGRAARRRNSSRRCALQATGELERLPERLYEVARLRLRYPLLPLRELAARCEPPSTKASVHRRLRRIQDLVGA